MNPPKCECGFVLTGKEEDYKAHYRGCVYHEAALLKTELGKAVRQNDELKGQLELILSEKLRALDEWEKSRRLVESIRNQIQVAAQALQIQSRQECYRQLMAILGATEKPKCPPHYWVGPSREEAECDICGIKKCGATQPGSFGTGYGYPPICGKDKGHGAPHRDMVLNAEWD